MKINTNYKVSFIKDPYPVWVVDDLLDENLVDEIKKDWPDKDSPLWHSGYKEVNGKKNILEQRMLAISDLEKMPKNIGKIPKNREYCRQNFRENKSDFNSGFLICFSKTTLKKF